MVHHDANFFSSVVAALRVVLQQLGLEVVGRLQFGGATDFSGFLPCNQRYNLQIGTLVPLPIISAAAGINIYSCVVANNAVIADVTKKGL